MSEAFVETTVLTDYLLKRDGSEKRARVAFSRFAKVSVPQFAWKEYKRGPLRAFVWCHNKLVNTGSFAKMLLALQRLAPTPQRYLTATAVQAIHTGFVRAFQGVSLAKLVAKYGPSATVDQIHTDMVTLELHKKILLWNRRKKLFGGPVQPMACYPDVDVPSASPLIDLKLRDCPAKGNCSLQQHMSKGRLTGARSGIPPAAQKVELKRRRKLLRRLAIHPSTPMNPADCRVFGDAYFVVFCPTNATVLTTNMSDIAPMGQALQVAVASP